LTKAPKLVPQQVRNCSLLLKARHVDEVYRGYRIAIRLIDGHWLARVSEPGGRTAPVTAKVSEQQGELACAELARSRVDKYLAYIGEPPPSDGQGRVR
jgi:hypothetical protein